MIQRAETEVLIVGCGFTGSRVAERLRGRGIRVTGTHRAQIDFTKPGSDGQLRKLVTRGCLILHSIPTLKGARDRLLLDALGDLPGRVVYLSTTGVYGAAEFV